MGASVRLSRDTVSLRPWLLRYPSDCLGQGPREMDGSGRHHGGAPRARHLAPRPRRARAARRSGLDRGRVRRRPRGRRGLGVRNAATRARSIARKRSTSAPSRADGSANGSPSSAVKPSAAPATSRSATTDPTATGTSPVSRAVSPHYFVGLFFNNVLPTTVGGDAVRACRQRERDPDLQTGHHRNRGRRR
jgi:hypothetical protein